MLLLYLSLGNEGLKILIFVNNMPHGLEQITSRFCFSVSDVQYEIGELDDSKGSSDSNIP